MVLSVQLTCLGLRVFQSDRYDFSLSESFFSAPQTNCFAKKASFCFILMRAIFFRRFKANNTAHFMEIHVGKASNC